MGRQLTRGRTLPRRFYDRDALDVAPELLHKLLVSDETGERVAARLVEIEAYRGAAEPLKGVWVALRANIRSVLETVTLADVAAGALPEPVRELAEHPESVLDR